VSSDTSDIVIVGGGLAGLFCALKLAPCPVTVVTAAPIGEGASSGWAQGGIAAAIGIGDTAEKHTADTVVAGAGIVDEAAALAIAREAPARIDDLLRYGVPFDRDIEGKLALSREAAHGERRIVRVRGDLAGKAIMQALVAAVRATPSIQLIEGAIAEDLLVRDRAVTGLLARRLGTNERLRLDAGAVMLATGGIGHLFAVTTNPTEARGEGLAIAARAGALLADTEFVQFHPTAIAIGRDPAPLATEALRGEGATLINRFGERFMMTIHPDAELAPRDIVARAVFTENEAGRGAFLDARAALGASFAEHFPTVYATCLSAGIDPAVQPIPVAPAAHYHMGGIAVDARGRTSLEGLWAAGEVAATGMHGANRLASNSLLEAVVYAARIAETLSGAEFSRTGAQEDAPAAEAAPAYDASVQSLRDTMSAKVGVVRDAAGLSEALAFLRPLAASREHGADLRNMATTALLVAAPALRRTESRGGHFRRDFPHPDPEQARRTFITLAQAEAIAAEVS
jgi:L-aspartate oxidase